MESEMVLLTYLKIISSDASIPAAKGILIILKKDFFGAAYLSKCVQLFSHSRTSFSSNTNIFAQTFSTVFISPSSSEAFVDEDENGAARKKPRLPSGSRKKATKCNVATILGMDSRVTPRSIAYSAVLVCLFIDDFSSSHYTFT